MPPGHPRARSRATARGGRRPAVKSIAEITGALLLSEDTVKTHARRIFMKLSLRDRTQAVIVAYERGLVEPRAPAA